VVSVTALWLTLVLLGAGYLLSWVTAAPAARGVPVSSRLAEARRLVGSSKQTGLRG
jgi:hypothetical protein